MSLPDSLKELVEKLGASHEDVYDFGRLESAMRSTWSGATLSGVGLGTQYSHTVVARGTSGRVVVENEPPDEPISCQKIHDSGC